MANSTADGSVVIDVNMNVSQAEKRLGKLRGDIKKTEKEIADATKARDEAKQKGLFQASELDYEIEKLEKMKARLADIEALSKDKRISVEQREAYAAQIPAAKQEVSDQKARMQALRSEWNKTENSVERYNRKLEASNLKLDDLKTEAGILTQEIDEAVKKQNGFAKVSDASEKAMGRLGGRVMELAKSAFIFNVISRALTSLQQMTMKYIKTNDGARQAIAQMKGALLTLAQPLIEVVIPAFTLLVNILTKIITVVAHLVSALFGKTVKQSQDGAKALHKEANAIGAVGEAADEAAGSLAGFDEINSINTENAKGAGGGAAGSEIAPDFDFLDGTGGAMQEILDMVERIAPLVAMIGAGFALWGIGGMLPGVLGQIATALGQILVAVAGILIFWDGLTDAWEDGVDWGNLLEMILGLAAAASALYALLGPIAAGISLVVGGLAMLVTGFHDAMENGWNLQNVLLSIAGLLATGVGIALITGSWIPLLVAGILSVLLALTTATGHGEELLNGIREVIEGFKDFFVGVFTGDIEKAIGGIGKIFEGLKKTVFAVIDGLQDTLLSFLNWLDEKTGGKFHGIIETAKGFVTTFFSSVKETLDNLLDAVKQIFTGIIQFLAGVFTNDWDLAWEGVKSIFKGVWNGVVSLLEGAINIIIKGLNWLISQMNKIAFDVPGWVPVIGGKSVGVNIPSISEAQIPRLAQGAVIPPNREFLAVLGDQRRGTNIEAPLSTIEQAVENVLSRMGGGGDRPIQVNVMLDGKVVARNTVHHINDMTRQAGKPVLLL